LAKEELVEFGGKVSEVLPDNRFRVILENGFEVWAYSSGRLKKNRIRVLAGDRVTLEMSPYDLTKGRTVLRENRICQIARNGKKSI
jgi:translation initiation factor IF-1